MTGLVDGRVLYHYMHERIHPAGELHQDVTYRDMYDYLACLLVYFITMINLLVSEFQFRIFRFSFSCLTNKLIFLSLQISPCMGWLNSNATLREITSEVNTSYIIYIVDSLLLLLYMLLYFTSESSKLEQSGGGYS